MMRRSVAFRFSTIALVVATNLLALGAPPAGAQPEPALDTVLAPGDPQLTERIVERYTDLLAWILEVPVTKNMRESDRAALVHVWTDPKEAKSILGLLSGTAWLAEASSDDREFYRVDVQEFWLKNMRADKSDPGAQALLAAFDAAHPPIVAGNPPLTESMITHYVAFVGWLLEIPVTPAFAASQRAHLMQVWKDPKEVTKTMFVLKSQLDFARLEGGAPERDFDRINSQVGWIKGMRSEENDADSRALVAAFDVAHRPLAAGHTPLTPQAADAWAEFYCFLTGQAGGPRTDATQKVKDNVALALAIGWSAFPAEKQKLFADMPRRWAWVRWVWQHGQDADRQKVLAAWGPIVNPAPPADPQLAAAVKALARANAFMARDPNTVSGPEMLLAAKDADLLAAQYRRQGDLVGAGRNEEISRTLHTGSKQAYFAMLLQWKANGDKLAILRAQYAARGAMEGVRAMSNVWVSGDASMANVVTNINNSPYQTIVVPVVPR